MNDDLEHVVAQDGEAAEWNEGSRAAPQFPESLPSSRDKEFWDPNGQGAQMYSVSREELSRQREETLSRMKEHTKLTQIGQEIICGSCPFTHTLPIDTSLFTLDHTGQLTPIDKQV